MSKHNVRKYDIGQSILFLDTDKKKIELISLISRMCKSMRRSSNTANSAVLIIQSVFFTFASLNPFYKEWLMVRAIRLESELHTQYF
jgi:hypothetical protein